MRLRCDTPVLLMALVASLAAAAAGAIPQLATPAGRYRAAAAACPPGDTSGSCSVVTATVAVSFPPCPPGASACPPAVVTIRKDANHPYALQLDIPAPTGAHAGSASPANGTAAAADSMAPERTASPPAAKTTPRTGAPTSIHAGDTVTLQMNRLGVFSFRVISPAGAQLTGWNNDVRVVRPARYTRFQALGKHGWVAANPARIHAPGLYRWLR